MIALSEYKVSDITQLVFCMESNITQRTRYEPFRILQMIICGDESKLIKFYKKRAHKSKRKMRLYLSRRKKAQAQALLVDNPYRTVKPNQRRRGIG